MGNNCSSLIRAEDDTQSQSLSPTYSSLPLSSHGDTRHAPTTISMVADSSPSTLLTFTPLPAAIPEPRRPPPSTAVASKKGKSITETLNATIRRDMRRQQRERQRAARGRGAFNPLTGAPASTPVSPCSSVYSSDEEVVMTATPTMHLHQLVLLPAPPRRLATRRVNPVAAFGPYSTACYGTMEHSLLASARCSYIHPF